MSGTHKVGCFPFKKARSLTQSSSASERSEKQWTRTDSLSLTKLIRHKTRIISGAGKGYMELISACGLTSHRRFLFELVECALVQDNVTPMSRSGRPAWQPYPRSCRTQVRRYRPDRAIPPRRQLRLEHAPRRKTRRQIRCAQELALPPSLGNGEHDRHDRYRGHEHVEHESDDGSLSNSKIVLASLESNDAFQPVRAVGTGS